MVIGNLLYIIWDKQYAAIVIGRLLTSLAHGTVFIVLIIQAGENASKHMRATRLMAALTNNLLINIVMIGSCEMILYHYQYAPLMIIAPRLAMSIIQVLYADALGRKIQFIFSAMLAGLALFGLGVVLNVLTINDSTNHYVPCLFFMWFQVLCGVGVQQMSDVYLAEAFSTAKKPWSMSFVLGIEHTFHIFMIGMAFTTIAPAGLHRVHCVGFIFNCCWHSFSIHIARDKGSDIKSGKRFVSQRENFEYTVDVGGVCHLFMNFI